MPADSAATSGDARDGATGTGPGADATTDELARQLVRFIRLVNRAKQYVVKPGPDGVERAAYAILSILIQYGPQRASRLAENLHSDISTISRQSGSLVRHGLVERQADPEDGRASLLAATDEGVRVFEENRKQHNLWLTRVLADWSDADRSALTGLFDRLNTAIEGCDPPAATSPTGGSASGGADNGQGTAV